MSIGDLMFAGLIPAFWIMACVLCAAYYQAMKFGYPKTAEGTSMMTKSPRWYTVFLNLAAALPGIGVVAIIIVCIIKGISTATEAAAMAVTYSLILTALVYRTMTKEKLFKALAKGSKTTGVVPLLIGVSNMLGWQMAWLEIPERISAALLTATTTPWLMLLCIKSSSASSWTWRPTS